jgi:hypothetical protein
MKVKSIQQHHWTSVGGPPVWETLFHSLDYINGDGNGLGKWKMAHFTIISLNVQALRGGFGDPLIIQGKSGYLLYFCKYRSRNWVGRLMEFGD